MHPCSNALKCALINHTRDGGDRGEKERCVHMCWIRVTNWKKKPSNEIVKKILLSLTGISRFLCLFLTFTRLLFTLQNGWVLSLMLLFGCKNDIGFMWGMKNRIVLGIFRFYFIFTSYTVTLQRRTSFLISKRNPSDKLHSLWGEGFCQNQDERCLFAVALMWWEVCFLDATNGCIFQLWVLYVVEFSLFFQQAIWETLYFERVIYAVQKVSISARLSLQGSSVIKQTDKICI